MNRLTGSRGEQALAILGPKETLLLRELDRTFARWGLAAGADEISPPPLYPVTDLEKFDVYDNFPHLAWVAGSLDLETGEAKPVDGAFDRAGLREARYGLPHATCYGAYLFHEGGQVADDTLVTLVNRCFRNEDHYGGLRRLASFQMREIVALGSYEHTQQVIARSTERILRFSEALGLGLVKEAATDPFFRNDGARALLAKLSPVKYEFQYGDLAIASVNSHRNFFGERCGITLASGAHAFTSCVAFGLERWLAVLSTRFDDDLDAALDAVHAAATDAG
ncbi:class-II aminoacyl-tRNA synthetase family protein [Streptomyces sp. SGAir0957]